MGLSKTLSSSYFYNSSLNQSTGNHVKFSTGSFLTRRLTRSKCIDQHGIVFADEADDPQSIRYCNVTVNSLKVKHILLLVASLMGFPAIKPSEGSAMQSQPLFGAGRILGLLPFNWGVEGYRSSTLWQVYSVLVVTGIAISNVLSVVFIPPIWDCRQGKVKKVVWYMNRVMLVTVIVVLLILLMARQFNKIQVLLKRHAINAIPGPNAGVTVKTILKIVVPFVIFYGPCFLNCVSEQKCVIETSQCFLYSTAWLLIFVEKILFMYFVLHIKKGYKMINEDLTKMMMSEKLQIQRYLSMDIIGLRKRHELLTDHLLDICECFEMQLLGIFVYEYICTTISTFSVLLECYRNGFGFSRDMLTFQILACAAPSVAVIVFSHKTAEEGNSCASIVHQYLNNNKQLTKEGKRELKLFSMQLSRRSVEVPILGLFSLNCELLFEVMGAVTMYVVILLQFQIAMSGTNECKADNVTVKIEPT